MVKAGLDVAQKWLDGDETLVDTIDCEGNMLHAITQDPLVVLVSFSINFKVVHMKFENVDGYVDLSGKSKITDANSENVHNADSHISVLGNRFFSTNPFTFVKRNNLNLSSTCI